MPKRRETENDSTPQNGKMCCHTVETDVSDKERQTQNLIVYFLLNSHRVQCLNPNLVFLEV